MDWGLIVYSYFPFIWVARVARLVFISWMIPFIIWYKLKHNKNVQLTTINELCKVFECDLLDVIAYIPDYEEAVEKK